MKKPAIVVALAVSLLGIGVSDTSAAPATPYDSFGPTVITGVPAAPPPNTPATQKVVPLATIDTPLTAGTTAYVYSELRAYDAAHANLIDNEVRCSGAGMSNVVMGENVLPSSGTPVHKDITLVTRFLVSATADGTLTCTLYLRTSSTALAVSRETVSGHLRFASTSVGEDVNGHAMQKSVPAGNFAVPSSLVTPVLDRTVPARYSKVAVIADVEYHRCANGPSCTANYSKARFRLTVTTSGGASCPSAPVAQIEESVPRGVNHAAVPLYTTVQLPAGCDTFHAKVTTSYLAGDVGTLGGAAAGLTDETGQSGSSPHHTSVMTHIFAVPS
jgi:hypothetical protein